MSKHEKFTDKLINIILAIIVLSAMTIGVLYLAGVFQ